MTKFGDDGHERRIVEDSGRISIHFVHNIVLFCQLFFSHSFVFMLRLNIILLGMGVYGTNFV